MIEKAKKAKSAEELLDLAKAGGVEMTADEAATYFAQLNPQSGELDDDALDGVAGGCGGSGETYLPDGTMIRVTSGQTCSKCGGTEGYATAGDMSLVVLCNKCHCTIVKFNECTYEIIG
jgi:hypothetical protein